MNKEDLKNYERYITEWEADSGPLTKEDKEYLKESWIPGTVDGKYTQDQIDNLISYIKEEDDNDENSSLLSIDEFDNQLSEMYSIAELEESGILSEDEANLKVDEILGL